MTMLMIYISVALRNSEIAILKPPSDDILEKQKQIQRRRHHNKLLEKFYAGQRDEKYVQDYYELLKKADKFIRTASPHKIAVSADSHGMLYAKKDRYGRRYEHFGFFDEKHKYAGKTLGEVIDAEIKERRTNDDNFELIYIFDNKQIEVGLGSIFDVVEADEKGRFIVNDLKNTSKKYKFPIKIHRDNEKCVNKIEQLTEYLHVKKVGFEFRRFEFFIPLKYRTADFNEDSKIFKDIVDIKEIHIKDQYGELISFGVTDFDKRVIYNNTHEVLKFNGFEMEKLN